MGIYYRLDSSGDETNLQVYSLHQAARYWNELLEDIDEVGTDEEVADLKERLVFILNCLGLSLSQLLGQNWPCSTKDALDNPGTLLGSILKSADIDHATRKRLNKRFQEFLDYYGAIRHFGRNRDAQIYMKVDDITFTKVRFFRDLSVEIWDTILDIFKRDDQNDLDDIGSITDVVRFKDIAEQEDGEGR